MDNEITALFEPASKRLEALADKARAVLVDLQDCDRPICPECNGSGEARNDLGKCWCCGGAGELESDK